VKTNLVIGDLVVMPGSPGPATGIVVDDVMQYRTKHSTRGRIGILWADGDGVDYEPADWLEVVSNSRDSGDAERATLNP
jgi:hypothetical protein